MKYVASMKMEHCASPVGLDKLLKSLEVYLKEHPPLTEETFLYMIDTAQRLGNDKLLEQCHVAKARCEETFQLLLLRQRTLQRARDQLQVEQKKHSPTRGSCKTGLAFKAEGDGVAGWGKQSPVRSDRAEGDGVGGWDQQKSPSLLEKQLPAKQSSKTGFVLRSNGDGVTIWNPQDTSTPRLVKQSAAGYTSPPLSPASSVNSSYLSESSTTDYSSQDVLGNGVVAKSVENAKSQYSTSDDGTPRSNSGYVKSRYSKDDANPRQLGSQKSSSGGVAKALASRSISQPIPDRSISLPIPDHRCSPVSHTRPLKKILKRASTNPSLYGSPLSSTIYEEKEAETAGDVDRKAKSISMITGSSESLPR